jgi:hypothetical protein
VAAFFRCAASAEVSEREVLLDNVGRGPSDGDCKMAECCRAFQQPGQGARRRRGRLPHHHSMDIGVEKLFFGDAGANGIDDFNDCFHGCHVMNAHDMGSVENARRDRAGCSEFSGDFGLLTQK